MRVASWIGIATSFALVACSGGGGGPHHQPDAGEGAGPPDGDAPPASAGHDLVYDDALGRVLLVNAGLGGLDSPPRDEPTRIWGWDGSAWSLLDATGPPIRNLGAVAYDAKRDVLVLHGGSYDANVSYDDTWEWRAPHDWQRIDAGGPGVRDHTRVTYDAALGAAVLFGGQESTSSFPDDTWTWDGTTWERHEDPGPTPRVHHAMGYDPVAEEVVVFGGYEPGVRDHGDTWAWSATGWSELHPDGATRTHARMAFDDDLGALVLVGGFGGDAVLVLRGAGWEPLDATGAPPPRYLPGVAYDPKRNVLVVFGGGDPASDRLLADTWELDGATWSRR